MGNYIYDNIGYHISVVETKHTTVLGKKIRCTRGFKKNGPGGFKVFYLPKGQARPELWPIAIKKAFDDLGELNEKDLTIGYEDQIFFQFDKSEV